MSQLFKMKKNDPLNGVELPSLWKENKAKDEWDVVTLDVIINRDGDGIELVRIPSHKQDDEDEEDNLEGWVEVDHFLNVPQGQGQGAQTQAHM